MTARRALVLPLLLAAIYLAAGALSQPTSRFGSDSYQYAYSTLRLLGHGPAAAHTEAVAVFCSALAERDLRTQERDPVEFRQADSTQVEARCLTTYRERMEPVSPRYRSVFAPRVGYPVIAAPFVAFLGVEWGMWLAAAVCAAFAGVLVWMLLVRMGAAPGWAAVGQGVLYLSPVGVWGSWALAEGAVYLGTCAVLLGAWLLAERRLAAGVVLAAMGLLVTAAAKYSAGLLVAAALAVGTVVVAAADRGARHRGVALLACGSALAVVAVVWVSAWRGWPGTYETLQDKWTAHFTLPDVPDPWVRLWELSGPFWGHWVAAELARPWLLAGVVFGLAGLWRHGRRATVLVGAVASTGFATLALHPIASQGDRLIAPLWLVVAVGVPLLLASRDRAASVTDLPVSATVRV